MRYINGFFSGCDNRAVSSSIAVRMCSCCGGHEIVCAVRGPTFAVRFEALSYCYVLGYPRALHVQKGVEFLGGEEVIESITPLRHYCDL